MNSETTHFLKQGFKWFLLATVPGILLVVGYIYLYGYPQIAVTVDENFEVSIVNENPPEGTILLSLISSEGEYIPSLLDITSGEAVSLPVVFLNNSEATSLQYNSSRDDTFMTFLGLNLNDETIDGPTDSFDVYRADIEKFTDAQSLIDSLETAQVLTELDENDYFRQAPVVSEMGEVLYTSISLTQYDNASQKSIGTISAESWNIYKIGIGGEKIVVTKGLYPKWIDAHTFAFLKNKGVYMYNTETNEEQLVWETSNEISMVNGFDVSDSGDYFAITSPAQEKVEIVSVENWSEQVFAPSTELTIIATNPVFSHNGNYLAMIVSWQDKNDVEKVDYGVEYYSIIQQDFVPGRVTFDEESIGGLYLTDWR